MDENYSVIISNTQEIEPGTSAGVLLSQIRPEWQAKDLIGRVERLMPVDASSACQRLFNAAIHDLRNKIITAGIDIAQEAAERHKLPPMTNADDILENYPTAKIIDLSYRMGILARPQWRRITRCYDIRRDLEHEDDEYEAELEDVIYIFKTCIEVVLSQDPVELIRLSDIEELINSPEPAIPSEEFLREFEMAPDSRQNQIMEHLINAALSSNEADIIRQNSMELLRGFSPLTNNKVSVQLGRLLQTRIGKSKINLLIAKVAHASGTFLYLKQRQAKDFYKTILVNFKSSGHQWTSNSSHRKLLEDFEDIGGFETCPQDMRSAIVLWMTRCYIGEPGGYGDYGKSRKVFYSNVAAPRIKRIFAKANGLIAEAFEATLKNKDVKKSLKDKFVARRHEELRDIYLGNYEE